MTHIVFLITGGAALAGTLVVLVTSIREGRGRATAVAAFLTLAVAALWALLGAAFAENGTVLLAAAGGVIGAALLFFAPLGRGKPILIGKITERVDERDVIFAREEYEPGGTKFDTYYAMHPEKRAVDDNLRKLPELLRPGGRFYDEVESVRIGSIFRVIEKLGTAVDGPVAPKRRTIDAALATEQIKKLTLDLGADEVGVAPLNPMFVYSHVGRGPEEWAAPIENAHRFALVFTLEMRKTSVDQAPRIPITTETATRYLQGAQISIALADHVRALGWPARAHIAGSNYQIMLPPVAHDAGLGELGRTGTLISRRFGARVRLGAITTDLPLVPDEPIVFGVQDFCRKCRKCATNCPSGAIPKGDPAMVRGVEKWAIGVEKCLHLWRVVGTDCGLCMKVCPFSHPPTLMHNLVRGAIGRSPVARSVSAWGDDLFYGRKDPWLRR